MKNAILLALAFLFALNTAHAGLYVGYADSDYRIEAYYGGSYNYFATPYTYAYDNYYYFDSPYRVYSQGSYYYYQPGWYSYYDTWRQAPDCIDCYNYYPSNYYYYNSAWNYYPNWQYTYGPMYYGSYYLPLSQPTLTGQQFHPQKIADCSQAGIIADSLSIAGGETKKVTAYLNNNSASDLDVENVNVRIEGFGASAARLKFDKVVQAGTAGKIEFEISAEDRKSTETLKANIEAAATFRDGTFCSASEIQKDFSVSVYSNAQQNNFTVQNPNLYNSATHYNVQGSTSYKRAKETQQQWVEVSPQASNTNSVQNNYAGTQNSASNASASNASVAYMQSQNASSQNGSAQNYSANGANGAYTTYYGEARLAAQNCEALSVGKENFSVASGASKTKYFQLRNFAGEDFTVDKIEAAEYSPDFSIEASRDATRVFAGETAALKIKVLADETEEDSTGAAYIKVSGHYGSGLLCSVFSENFYIGINGKPENRVNGIRLNAPAEVGMDGSSGFAEFELENPSNKQVAVLLSSDDVSISPSKFVFEPSTKGKRTFAVNGLEGKGARVYFSIVADGEQFLKKYVKISQAGGNQVYTEQANQVNAEDANANIVSNTLKGIQGAVATGFAVVSSNAGVLGIIVLVVLIVGLLGRKQEA